MAIDAPTPKIITATSADIRAYFAFRVFRGGEDRVLLGTMPINIGHRYTELGAVDLNEHREELLRFDQALKAWRTGDSALISMGYLFDCSAGCNQASYRHELDFNPITDDMDMQLCDVCGRDSLYGYIRGVSFDVKNLLADPEARETDVDIDFKFRRKRDGSELHSDFRSEYFKFLGVKVLETFLEYTGLAGVKSSEVTNLVYHTVMKLVDAPRITGTEGLVAEMRFHGKAGLFLPEKDSQEAKAK